MVTHRCEKIWFYSHDVINVRTYNVRRTSVRPSAPSCMPMWPVHVTISRAFSLELIQEAILHLTLTSLQHTSLIIGHQCYGQLTPVKTRYPLTSITWPYNGLKLDHIEVSCFFEVDRWPGTGCWLDRRLKPGQRLTQTPDRGLIFRALSVARRGYRAMLRQQKLLTVDAFRVQVRFGKYIFLAFFAGFSPGLT